MDVDFDSIEELYKRVKPALTTKKRELERNGYPYIREMDIWDYLKIKKWSNCRNLFLYQIVTDILNCDNIEIDNYLKSILELRNNKNYEKIEFEESE